MKGLPVIASAWFFVFKASYFAELVGYKKKAVISMHHLFTITLLLLLYCRLVGSGEGKGEEEDGEGEMGRGCSFKKQLPGSSDTRQ